MYGKTYQVGIHLPTRMRNVLELEEDKVEGGRASEVETKKESKRCSNMKQTGQVQVCVKNIVGGIKAESRDSVVGIVTRLRAGRPSSHGSVPGKEKRVVAFANPLYRTLSLSIFPLLRTWEFLQG